jgi:hypothetical protein
MDGARGEIWCYTDRYCYRAGETITLFVSSTAERYRIEIVRDGGHETPVAMVNGLTAGWQDTPDQCSVTGCGWNASHSIGIPAEWSSGAYRVTLTAEGRDGLLIRYHHLFILRPSPGDKRGRILQVAATGTWTAYNTWGGSNHYQGITGPGRNQYAPVVSIERPFCRGFVVLPPEAPRVPLEVAIPPAMPPRYPHMEWAYAHGYSKKYASSGWASYDSHFFRWAERSGYAIDLASQHELHFEPEVLEGYGCVVFVGHDEYWTWEMRDAVERYVRSGGKVARFAGNFMWQTRFEDEGRRQVCYKYRAAEDPILEGGDLTRLSTSWEDPRVGRPGRKPSASWPLAGFMSAGAAALLAASGAFRSIAPIIGRSREQGSITATFSERIRMFWLRGGRTRLCDRGRPAAPSGGQRRTGGAADPRARNVVPQGGERGHPGGRSIPLR